MSGRVNSRMAEGREHSEMHATADEAHASLRRTLALDGRMGNTVVQEVRSDGSTVHRVYTRDEHWVGDYWVEE
jgi:hypothetical protein